MSPSTSGSTRTTFFIEWGGFADLTIEEIWPDGNAPENPTTEDVKAAMLASGSYTVEGICREWMMTVEQIDICGNGPSLRLTDKDIREAREARRVQS